MRKNVALADLPECLTVTEIAGYLGIAKANAYALVKSDGFPRLRGLKKRLVVPKQAFKLWLQENTVTTSREV